MILSKISRVLSHNTNNINRKFSIISHVKARKIIDSRGNPTVEADVILTNGQVLKLQFKVEYQQVSMKLWN